MRLGSESWGKVHKPKEEEGGAVLGRQLVNSKQLSHDARYSIPCYARGLWV